MLHFVRVLKSLSHGVAVLRCANCRINGNIVARSPLGRNSCLRRGGIGIPGLKLQLSKLYSHTSRGHATGVPPYSANIYLQIIRYFSKF